MIEKMQKALQDQLPGLEIFGFAWKEMTVNGAQEPILEWQVKGNGLHRYCACCFRKDIDDDRIAMWAEDAAWQIRLVFKDPSDDTRRQSQTKSQ
jgi:hypothetical protein